VLTFAQFLSIQNRTLSGPSGQGNPLDNLPMGMRSEVPGRGTPESIFNQAIRGTGVNRVRDVYNTEDGETIHSDYVFAAPPRRNPYV
jgi:hypothetical protein